MQFALPSLLSSLLTLLIPQTPVFPTEPDSVRFTIELTSGQANPIGIGQASVILINCSFIGPTSDLELNQDVVFTVINNMAEDTTIHFHGISQKDTPWSDGVPGITQTPISSGKTYVYKWHANEPGVYFYHAHRRGQIQDGLYGAIVVRAPRSFERPFGMISDSAQEVEAMIKAEDDLTPLLISDWTQFSYEEVMQMQKAANIDWNCFDAIIINGVGAQYCSSRSDLENFTSPGLKKMLAAEGFAPRLTDKGCVPPITAFQGDFERNMSVLPPTVYDKCLGRVGQGANYTVTVRSKDRWTALTFINPGGLYPLKVTIGNHEMWVYAVDGRYIHPVLVDQIVVTNGARLSTLIRLDQMPGRYLIRISTALMGQVLSGFANLDYNGIKHIPNGTIPSMDYAGRPLRDLRTWEDHMAKPYPPLSPARKPDRTFRFLLQKLGRPHGAWEWTLSGSRGYELSEEERTPPLLFLPREELPNGEIFVKTNKDKWVDLIIEIQSSSSTHPEAMPHPMHKHGNKVSVLGTGVGHFVWDTVAQAAVSLPNGTFNFDDPPLRDSIYMPSDRTKSTWIALRYKAEQVGAWLLHCHIQTHLSGGMAIVLLDGIDQWRVIPR